ncbi:c-type cytochrome [Prosthecomicrobium sp. N25]|uniref:c-type cytochrome n=1 Tax=Prosthecomicrobium sp. N25 TaxID=3129254 RepID=UPI003076886D
MPYRPPRVTVAGLLLAVATGVAGAQSGTAPADPGRGRGVVVGAGPGGQRQACLACHGLEGRGDPAAGFPRLDGQMATYLYKALADYASGVRPNEIMTPIAKALTEQQRRDVAVHYATQDPTGPGPTGAAARPAGGPEDYGLVQRGAVLSSIGAAEHGVQACQNCHGPDGAGLAPLVPALAGQHEGYLRGQLQAWKAGRRGGDPAGVMAGIARRMDDRDVSAAARYFASLPPAPRSVSGVAAITAVVPEAAGNRTAASGAPAGQRQGDRP